MSGLLSAAATAFRSVREQLAPLPSASRFREQGTLTPAEFVAAGDLLVRQCPTWQWAPGLPEKRRDYLPEGRQYLVTRNVPCRRRAGELEAESAERMVEGEEGGEGWVETHAGREGGGREVGEIGGDEAAEAVAKLSLADAAPAVPAEEAERPPDDEIPDFDEDGLLSADPGVVEADDPGALRPDAEAAPGENILRTRTYDLSITYDKYYQTPRVWLFGYAEDRTPLSPPQIFEDISQDHARKTVTVEPHPHERAMAAGIHPCRHAGVMRKLAEMMGEGSGEGMRAELYLLVFLKFMSSVLPTIDYDYTISM
ncbi:autophagocytosis protein [Hyaloraphidium curvatum]|nr:autophagocytosis protein [Hyaloraphidium curvatum]